MHLAASILLCVAALHLLTGTGQSAASMTYPETTVGSRAAAFFTAYNSGDEAAMQRYVAFHFDPAVFETVTADALVQWLREVWNEFGLLTPVTIGKHTQTALTLHVRAEKTGDTWLKVQFAVATSSPAKLHTFSVHPSVSPDLADKTYDQWQNLTDLVREAARDIGVPGMAVAVIKDGQMDTAAWGVRAQGLPEAIHQGDRFHLGSVTKSITATMIGKLVELGVLDWTSRIGDILPDMDMRPEYRTVTLEELLQHRGGIVAHKQQTYSDEQLDQFKTGNPTELRAAYVAEVLNQPPIGPSGGHMHYSNAGYTITGYMAERVTGQSWENLVQTHVFAPLHLANADFGWPATVHRPDQPRGHLKTDATLAPQPLDDRYTIGPLLAPAGDVQSSITDLATYAAAHLQGLRGHDSLLKSKTIRRLHTAPTQAQEPVAYAAGWVVEKRWGEGLWHWHNGSAGTFYALVMIHPASNIAIAVAMNAAPGAHETVAMNLAHAIYRHTQNTIAD